jgi:hypothetical protein
VHPVIQMANLTARIGAPGPGMGALGGPHGRAPGVAPGREPALALVGCARSELVRLAVMLLGDRPAAEDRPASIR